MTPDEINALPRKVQDYIHRLVANGDPTLLAHENASLREQVRALTRMVEELLEARGAAAQHLKPRA